ncbi:hypothetical protein CRYUN_Cryun32bG0024200 [Craigia yunnanensis]
MEFSFPSYQISPWHYLLAALTLFSNQLISKNHVHWTETPESHVYSADLPGIDGILAGYEDGVLTVTVPRTFKMSGVYIDPADVLERLEVFARVA